MTQARPVLMVAGYRLLRELCRGDRSEVHLALDGEGRRVVLKILPATKPDDTADSVIADLDCDHVLPTIDVATLDDGRIVIVSPLVGGGTLGELLAERSSLELGEAITVLISVARGIASLHSAGWAHRRLDPANILLSESGVPVLAGLGWAAPLDEQTRQTDRGDLLALARRLLDAHPEALAIVTGDGPAPAPEVLEAELAGFAAPTPLSRQQPSRPRETAVHWLTPQSEAAPVEGSGGDPILSGRVLARWRKAVHRSLASVDDLTKGGRHPSSRDLLDRAAQLVGPLAAVRRRTWVLAGCVVVALVASLALVPQEASPPDAAAVGREVPAEAERVGSSTAAPAAPAADEAVTGDDPLLAADALIVRQQRCLEAQSAACIAQVAQHGSAAARDLSAAIDRIVSGAVIPPPLNLGQAPLVQRTGDSALVAGETISLLLIRGDEGWRIRDVFDSPESLPDETAG